MSYLRFFIGLILFVSSAPLLAQQNQYKFDLNNKTELLIPAFSKGQSTTVVDDPSPIVLLEMIGGAYVKTIDGQSAPLSSCAEYIQQGLGYGQSGVYQSTHEGGLNIYCEMNTDGGGWTLIVVQYESSPQLWSGGRGAYDPSLSNQLGWTMASVPSHGQVGFSHVGRSGLYPKYYMNFTYTTGNIPKSLITDQNGVSYYIHRNSAGYYNRHDPEYTYKSIPSSMWRNTLTVDYLGETTSNALWTFSPHHTYSSPRGFAYEVDLQQVSHAQPWVVFVR